MFICIFFVIFHYLCVKTSIPAIDMNLQEMSVLRSYFSLKCVTCKYYINTDMTFFLPQGTSGE